MRVRPSRRQAQVVGVAATLALAALWSAALAAGGRSRGAERSNATDGHTAFLPAILWAESFAPPPPASTAAPTGSPSPTEAPTPEPTPTIALDCDTPTPVPPSPTPEPPPSASPPSWHRAPPPAILLVGGTRQQSAVGTYCWRPSGLCVDTAIVTPAEPLRLRSPIAGRLLIQPAEPPRILLMTVAGVTEAEEEGRRAGERWWRLWDLPDDRMTSYELSPLREVDVQLAREPGLYVVAVGVAWPSLGNASYGFLVEVTP